MLAPALIPQVLHHWFPLRHQTGGWLERGRERERKHRNMRYYVLELKRKNNSSQNSCANSKYLCCNLHQYCCHLHSQVLLHPGTLITQLVRCNNVVTLFLSYRLQPWRSPGGIAERETGYGFSGKSGSALQPECNTRRGDIMLATQYGVRESCGHLVHTS